MNIFDPRHSTPSEDDGTSKLYLDADDRASGKFALNNNPDFPHNAIDRLSTPFDHVERILLQDFSDEMFKDGNNYFKDKFEFGMVDSSDSQFTCGLNSIRLNDECSDGYLIDRTAPFFLNSFTYTPFIDHS